MYFLHNLTPALSFLSLTPLLDLSSFLLLPQPRIDAQYLHTDASPQFPPTTLTLHSLTSRLAKLAGARYGIHVPEANAAPMLWRVTKYMGGTREWCVRPGL